MTVQEIEAELKTITERIDNADEWFKSHGPVDDESKEYKLLRELIKRGAYLQGLLNERR